MNVPEHSYNSSRSLWSVTGACDSPRQLYQQELQVTGSASRGEYVR